MQPKGKPDSIYFWKLPPTSEDCLSLNIWAPANAQKAPVFFWIHGGALSGGSGSDALYDGTKLAAARHRRRDDQLPPGRRSASWRIRR